MGMENRALLKIAKIPSADKPKYVAYPYQWGSHYK
jgi:hypothetical protein